MFNFLKSLLGIGLVILLGYGLYLLATKSTNDSINTLRIAADNTTTIVGTVLVNKNDCTEQDAADPRCFLKLRVGMKDIYVIYMSNDNSFCPNEFASSYGVKVKEGATVKVYGFYRQDGDLNTVLTCPTVHYYIQTL
jgi:hypothetical protein